MLCLNIILQGKTQFNVLLPNTVIYHKLNI